MSEDNIGRESDDWFDKKISRRRFLEATAAVLGTGLVGAGAAKAKSSKDSRETAANTARSDEQQNWTIESLQARMQKDLDAQATRFLALRAGGSKKMKHVVDNTYSGRPGANEEELFQFSVPTGKTVRFVDGGKISELPTYDIYDAYFTKGPHSPREVLGLEITLGGVLSSDNLANSLVDGAVWHSVLLPNNFNVDNYTIISNVIHDPTNNPSEAKSTGSAYTLNLKTGGQRIIHSTPTTSAPGSGPSTPTSLDSIYQAFEGFLSASGDFIDKYSD